MRALGRKRAVFAAQVQRHWGSRNGRAVIAGSLASKIKGTGKVITTDYSIILTVADGAIIRFQMLEDIFAVSRAARAPQVA